MRYDIIETTVYTVEADSPEQAEALWLESEDPNQDPRFQFEEVTEREIVESPVEPQRPSR